MCLLIERSRVKLVGIYRGQLTDTYSYDKARWLSIQDNVGRPDLLARIRSMSDTEVRLWQLHLVLRDHKTVEAEDKEKNFVSIIIMTRHKVEINCGRMERCSIIRALTWITSNDDNVDCSLLSKKIKDIVGNLQFSFFLASSLSITICFHFSSPFDFLCLSIFASRIR